MSDQDINSIFYWWPIIKDLGIPVPRTTLIPYDGTIFIEREEANEEFIKLVDDVRKVCDEYGYPVFIRCGGLSAKHEWKDTCYVTDPDKLDYQIRNIITSVLMIMGIRLDFDGIAVREFLKLESSFTAFGGDMPIAKEFRFFARDGDYECHHPYWPPTSLWRVSSDNWYQELKEMQQLIDAEFNLLKDYTRILSRTLDKKGRGTGWWSLDFCKTIDGIWYLTDLATGAESYHWSTCPHAPEKMRDYPDPEDPEKLAEIDGPTARAERIRLFKERYKED